LSGTGLSTVVFAAAFLLLAGCGSDATTYSAAPKKPTGTAGASDSACIPQTQNQGCHNAGRMWCEDTTSTWQNLGSCKQPLQCIELPDPKLPGAKLASCEEVVVVPPDAGGTDGGSTGGDDGGTVKPTGVCARWLTDREKLPEGKWTGNSAKCEPGTLSEDAKEAALRLVNLYRFLAHQPAVTRAADLDAKAQACALIMKANGKISHFPTQTWKCWSKDGALAAKKSNLSTGPGVRAVDRYMVDNGAHNAPTMGHRRWILSRTLGPIGVGSSTSKGSCLWVIGGKGNSPRKWVAWPPDGEVPLAAFGQGGGSIDQTGWTLQSDSVSLHNAKVKVTVGGVEKPVKQRPLKSGYGSKHAIAWVPQGWKAQAGTTYHVAIKGASTDFEYDVKVLACGL